MYFNWRQFLKDSLHSLFPSQDHQLRLTGHRARVLVVYFLCMIWMVGLGRLCFLLDRVFYRKANNVTVRKPLFIIGNFRSGSTLLHRLLASDPQFTAMKTWEIYFAPSVIQRRFWRGFWEVDRWFGHPILNGIKLTQQRTFSEVKMHRINLGEPEEDEALLMYLWDSLFNWFFMPYQADSNPYWRFDASLPQWRRRKIMAFYHACLRRHLYAHAEGYGSATRSRTAAEARRACAGQTTYVSKNPSFSAKLESLLAEFPDARIVFLVRHPADTLVSTIGWFSFAWSYFASLTEQYPFRSTIMELTREWYLKPAEVLSKLPESQYQIVKYEDLVAHPHRTVTELLRHFELTPGVETSKQLDDLENGPPVHKSHTIELKHVGLDPGLVAEYYAEVFKRFGYEE